MVTRGLGDFGMKYKKPSKKILSNLDIPYIISKPVINTYEIHNKDQCLILATDGLWDFLTPQ